MRVQLLEIDVPVMDNKGFVYEKKDVVDHIKRQRTVGESVLCPVHGNVACALLAWQACMHNVSAQAGRAWLNA